MREKIMVMLVSFALSADIAMTTFKFCGLLIIPNWLLAIAYILTAGMILWWSFWSAE